MSFSQQTATLHIVYLLDIYWKLEASFYMDLYNSFPFCESCLKNCEVLESGWHDIALCNIFFVVVLQ